MSAGPEPPPGAGDPAPADLSASARRFGGAGAALYPLLGRPIPTPGGPGVLLQVLGGSCRVLLPGERATRTYAAVELLRQWQLAATGPGDVDPGRPGAARDASVPGGVGSDLAWVHGPEGRRTR